MTWKFWKWSIWNWFKKKPAEKIVPAEEKKTVDGFREWRGIDAKTGYASATIPRNVKGVIVPRRSYSSPTQKASEQDSTVVVHEGPSLLDLYILHEMIPHGHSTTIYDNDSFNGGSGGGGGSSRSWGDEFSKKISINSDDSSYSRSLYNSSDSDSSYDSSDSGSSYDSGSSDFSSND